MVMRDEESGKSHSWNGLANKRLINTEVFFLLIANRPRRPVPLFESSS